MLKDKIFKAASMNMELRSSLAATQSGRFAGRVMGATQDKSMGVGGGEGSKMSWQTHGHGKHFRTSANNTFYQIPVSGAHS